MSEHDLNQAKSKGGSLWSVQALNALLFCSLSVVFTQHSGVTGK